MRKNIFLAQKYEVPIVTTSSAISVWGMRAGRELAAFAHLLGLTLPQAIDTVSSIPQMIIHKNRDKLSGRATEGVSIV